MKLTTVLLKQHLNRMFLLQWRVQSKRRVYDMQVPERLRQCGVSTRLATDVVKDSYDKPYFPAPLPSKDEFVPENDPNWHDRICYNYNQDIRLLEGTNHAASLTKTIVNNELPSHYQSLLNQVNDELEQRYVNMDRYVQNILKQASIWDAWQLRLPVKVLKHPGHLRRPYGIPISRTNAIIWEGLQRISDVYFGKYPKFFDRILYPEVIAKNHTEKDGDLISWEAKADFMLSSKTSLQNLVSKEGIQEYSKQEVPNIFPLKATIDLIKNNIYTLENKITSSLSNAYSNIHTVIFTNDESQKHSQAQLVGNGICNCFTFALTKAKQLYGDSLQGELPEPITVQGIQANSNSVAFIVYQLNTVDVSGNEGTKNIAWIDSGNMFHESCDKFGLVGYEPKTVRKVLSFYKNGLV